VLTAAVGVLRPRRLQLELCPHPAVAENDEMDVCRQVRQRGDQLLDPAVRHEAAVVQHDLVGRREREGLVEPSRGVGGTNGTSGTMMRGSSGSISVIVGRNPRRVRPFGRGG
jgi:hypothetical protein